MTIILLKLYFSLTLRLEAKLCFFIQVCEEDEDEIENTLQVLNEHNSDFGGDTIVDKNFIMADSRYEALRVLVNDKVMNMPSE